MERRITMACLLVALVFADGAFADERLFASQPTMLFGAAGAKAAGDTVDLMGPGGFYPYRGDFETASARPSGNGFLTDSWVSVDETAPLNPWHVDTYHNPFAGNAAWCGDIGVASCGAGDPDGGYLADWKGILELHKPAPAAGSASVLVTADMQYDTESGYDFVSLQRRTAASGEGYEPLAGGGQGLSWSGIDTTAVSYQFEYLPADLVAGTDIAVAFIFAADSGYDDGDCLVPTDGAVRIDNVNVTVTVGTSVDAYTDDFEIDLGNWVKRDNIGVGNFARVWSLMGDADDCASNYTKLIAYIDDGLVVPGTGGTVGGPGFDYGPPGGYVVNCTGGILTEADHLNVGVYSPVMELTDPNKSGLTFAFDVYRHELLVANDTPGIFYTWSVRSTAGGDINLAGWKNRNFVYYGGPNYLRAIQVVDDLMTVGATQCQVTLGVNEYGWAWDYNGTNATPAPYFDNVSVKVYPMSGPRISVTEIRQANDGFPAIGVLDLADLSQNSVRFDTAANISARTHLRNDPGDSIWVDVTPRGGGVLSLPVMHWKFAAKNPLFTDGMRTALTAGQMDGTVTGKVTRNAAGAVVPNRYEFDLPDTGMLFPGDVLHYYYAATDDVGGDIRTSYAPFDRAGFGNPDVLYYSSAYTVNCLPSLLSATGTQPVLLFWNDGGIRGGEDEWYGALRRLDLENGVDYDVYTTKGPTSGVGNGLGGRAAVSQIAGYTDMLYSSGDLNAPTLSNGDFTADAGNDLGLLNDWFALGGRDLFMTGDDLANSLYTTGTVASAFLETKMGVTYNNDSDVRDNIGGQIAPLVVKIAGNPVFTTANSWIAYGGCFDINDFDNVTPSGSAIRLAQFTAPGGALAAYACAAATLNVNGTNRVVSMNHDLRFVIDPAKVPAPLSARGGLLKDVLDYFGVAWDWGGPSGGVPPAVSPLVVASYPNPFNPSVTMRFTLARPGHVTMKVFDARGAAVRTLLDGHVELTSGAVTWNGDDQRGQSASSGLYFVETRADGQVDVRKVTMLK